ncbi:hypothetical protein GALMADRAFT_258395 [Galerina marginata CBS 339.88]|uniref:BTB domain-containing protein n=1 Tax=Galerina marginata (strain CBS 339.88) TaxID=685588 RepID=A0A067SBY5_GALM3|nr:hypothetical protein GALMADRAFT_258395 [Galerina marginata CBS 339.88]
MTDLSDIHVAVPAQEAMKPWRELISEQATKSWQEDLESLCLDAENRFPDIVWHTNSELGKLSSTVWAHKAMVSARWTPAFKSRYLTQSLNLKSNSHGDISQPTFLPKHACDYTAISHDLLQLYTAGSNKIEDENKFDIYIQKKHRNSLRKDLIYMWRSRTYSDVCITLPLGTTEDSQSHIFWSHRFLLSSRSPYFHRVLARGPGRLTKSSEEPSITQLTLPSTHFTMPALHFILGYLYIGTLKSRRGYDLVTALFIFSGSLYLELPVLKELVLAEIMVKMHGMYHALLLDAEYSRLVDGNWTTAVNLGCQCRTCARHAPHILQFARERGITNGLLERGARRAIVGLFGEGWCTERFSALPDDITGLILNDVREMITASNVLPMLFAAESALFILENPRKDWRRIVKSSILSVRELIDSVLCANAGICLKSPMWRELMDGSKINAGENSFEQVTWVLRAILRGANPENASALYQALGSSSHSRFRPFSIWVRVERAQVELQKIDLSAPSPSSSIHHLNLTKTDNLLSSGASIYSCISIPRIIAPLSEEQANIAGYNPYITALDLATVSSCSMASSRTASTDYGLYYTRWAISRDLETVQDWESIRTVTRRRSWDSFGC